MSELSPLPDAPIARYRHYKGGLYELTGVARHSESHEPMVVYRPLYGEGALWVRPFSMFFEEVVHEGQSQPRFSRVGPEASPGQVEQAGTPLMPAAPANGLAGRVIAVTGASRGIGHAIAELLARSGARVIAGARNAPVDHVAGIEWTSLDVCDEASVRAFAELALQAGADSVVNNAGIGVFGPIESATVEDYQTVFDTNVLGTLLVAKHLMPAFRRRHDAGLSSHLVCVTSDVSTRSFAGGAVYAASKHAQRAITQTVAREGEAFGLRVTEVRPGMTDTHFNSQTPGQPERAGHLRPQDVAQAVLFALSAPQHVRVDEVVVHPVAQGVEY